jgi:hypothetical protein
MAIISSSTMIRSISLFHITLAALLLRNPAMIANQSIVLILGQSMQLVAIPLLPLNLTTTNYLQPTPREFQNPSASIAFLAILFAFIGLSDVTAVSMNEELCAEYWGAQAPMRLLFLFGLTAYTYMFKEGGLLAKRTQEHLMSKGDTLNNSIVFTWGFLEMAAWFWIYTTLRDERREKVAKVIAQRKADAKRL